MCIKNGVNFFYVWYGYIIFTSIQRFWYMFEYYTRKRCFHIDEKLIKTKYWILYIIDGVEMICLWFLWLIFTPLEFKNGGRHWIIIPAIFSNK